MKTTFAIVNGDVCYLASAGVEQAWHMGMTAVEKQDEGYFWVYQSHTASCASGFEPTIALAVYEMQAAIRRGQYAEENIRKTSWAA